MSMALLTFPSFWAISKLTSSVMDRRPHFFYMNCYHLTGFHTGTNLYCLLVHGCGEFAQGCCAAVQALGDAELGKHASFSMLSTPWDRLLTLLLPCTVCLSFQPIPAPFSTCFPSRPHYRACCYCPHPQPIPAWKEPMFIDISISNFLHTASCRAQF